MDVSSILNDLNDAQRQAVTAPLGNTLVLAGAGSGKTRVLVHRIAWLVQVENISAHSVLAVTFTNKAAHEMRNRIEQLLGLSPQGMWVGTFHSLAHRLLKMHWQEAKLPQNFQILDSDDQLRLVKRVHKELALDDEQWPPRQSQWFINGQKDEGRRASYIEDNPRDHSLHTMLKVYRAYEDLCQRQGMVDFAELLLRAHELWLNQPALLAHYQRRFRYMLVDEFQDTNSIQYAWLRVLSAGKIPIMAVGDDDQSIYGWRGARIENIQQFSKDFAGENTLVETIKLEQNYRSTGTILKAANSVIANNQGRLGKELWTGGEDGELISVYAGFNEQDEARFIVERMEEWSRAGNVRREAAILYRSNAQSRILEEALIRAGVPYRIYGGQRFYERLEIKNALAYLRLIANPHDDTAIERAINTPTRGIGARSIEQLRELAREQGISLWSAIEKTLAANSFTARAANALRGFVELIQSLDGETDELTLGELVEHTLKRTGLKLFHASEKGEKGQVRVENLDELIIAAQEFEPEDDPDDDERSPLQAFLDEAALNAGDQQADAFEDSVQLMTLHSAKGLEFPLVVVAGMEENLFPHKMSMDEPGRLEEERRLCYVGITRAMQKLYLTYAESRRLYGSESINPPSRFLREIPSECLQEVRLSTTITRPLSYRSHSSTLQTSANDIQLGQRVMHQMFGEGMVTNLEGAGPNARVQVNFADAGAKWLVYQYANLQVLS